MRGTSIGQGKYLPSPLQCQILVLIKAMIALENVIHSLRYPFIVQIFNSYQDRFQVIIYFQVSSSEQLEQNYLHVNQSSFFPNRPIQARIPTDL